MKREGVPIRPVGVGPIEPCAKCGRPTDLTEWHMTYLDQDIRFGAFIGQPLDVNYLAVLCRACEGKDKAEERVGQMGRVEQKI